MKNTKHIITLIIISIVGLLINWGLFSILNTAEESRLTRFFEFGVNQRLSAIERSVETQQLTMLALQNHERSISSRSDFKAFTKPFLDRVIGIQALEWVPRIRGDEREKYVNSAREDGITDFEINVRDSARNLVPAPQKAEYYPVYFLEPLEGNEAAMGFDLSSNEERLNALNESILSGEVGTTGRITLVQGELSQSGFLTLYPVYNKPLEELSELERQEEIKGFALGVFVVQDLIEESVALFDNDRIDIYVSDITEPNQPEPLYYHNSIGTDEAFNDRYFIDSPTGVYKTTTLSIGSRLWQLTFVPTDAFLSGFQTNNALIILVIGILATALLVGYINVTTTRSITIRNLVELRTRELELSKQEAEKTKDLAEKANQSKTDFISNVSHELRTPLNGILGLSHAILKSHNENLSTNQIKGLEMVHRSGMRLLDLINEVLDLAKVEAGTMNYNERPMRIKGILNHVENLFKGLMESRVAKKQDPLDLFIRTEGFTPEFILTDRRRLEQILVNLIGNAVKFTHKGSITITVKVVESSIWFEVSDTGIGISKDQLAQVFDKFQQVDGSSSRSYEGTGLGLSLSKSLVQLLGGEIAVESELGIGTTMRLGFLLRGVGKKLEIAPYEIYIPKEKYYPFGYSDQSKKMHDNLSKLKRSLDSVKKTPQQTVGSNVNSIVFNIKDEHKIIENKSVLLCSGNDESRSVLASCLRQFNIKLTERTNATTAFEILSDVDPDIIIIEPNLPDMPISSFINMIESAYTTVQTSYVIVGGSNTLSFEQSQSHVSFVDTPLNADVFIDTISQSLRLNQAIASGDEKLHILIADDEEVGRALLKMILENKYRLSFAENGLEAVQLYFETKPDLVLMDIMMPKLDGIGALSQIAEQDSEHVPVIALTAKAMKDDEQGLLDQGFSHYISKPFDSKKLSNAINDFLTKGHSNGSN